MPDVRPEDQAGLRSPSHLGMSVDSNAKKFT